MLIDTHVHLNNDTLYADLPGVLARATDARVERFIVVGYDVASSARAVALAEGDARVFAVVGVHPHDARAWSANAEKQLRAWVSHEKVVAIGEIGLDFYRDLSPRPDQFATFRAQLALAAEVQLPVVIHCRDAYEETLEVLDADASPDLPVILHCFLGTLAHAARIWDRPGGLGFLGVDGPITFKTNDDLRAVIRAVPRACLLLETDAPYLSPLPFRGKFPNEPARLVPIAETVAQVRGETVAEVAAYTAANARRAFARLAPVQ